VRKHKNHIIYYFSVLALISGGLALIIYLSPQRDLQMLVLMGVSIIYAILGITHHLLNHDLVFKIVLEYVVVATLGVAIAYFIFRGGLGI
jgi:phosphate/sulfate permease